MASWSKYVDSKRKEQESRRESRESSKPSSSPSRGVVTRDSKGNMDDVRTETKSVSAKQPLSNPTSAPEPGTADRQLTQMYGGSQLRPEATPDVPDRVTFQVTRDGSVSRRSSVSRVPTEQERRDSEIARRVVRDSVPTISLEREEPVEGKAFPVSIRRAQQLEAAANREEAARTLNPVQNKGVAIAIQGLSGDGVTGRPVASGFIRTAAVVGGVTLAAAGTVIDPVQRGVIPNEAQRAIISRQTEQERKQDITGTAFIIGGGVAAGRALARPSAIPPSVSTVPPRVRLISVRSRAGPEGDFFSPQLSPRSVAPNVAQGRAGVPPELTFDTLPSDRGTAITFRTSPTGSVEVVPLGPQRSVALQTRFRANADPLTSFKQQLSSERAAQTVRTDLRPSDTAGVDPRQTTLVTDRRLVTTESGQLRSNVPSTQQIEAAAQLRRPTTIQEAASSPVQARLDTRIATVFDDGSVTEFVPRPGRRFERRRRSGLFGDRRGSLGSTSLAPQRLKQTFSRINPNRNPRGLRQKGNVFNEAIERTTRSPIRRSAPSASRLIALPASGTSLVPRQKIAAQQAIKVNQRLGLRPEIIPDEEIIQIREEEIDIGQPTDQSFRYDLTEPTTPTDTVVIINPRVPNDPFIPRTPPTKKRTPPPPPLRFSPPDGGLGGGGFSSRGGRRRDDKFTPSLTGIAQGVTESRASKRFLAKQSTGLEVRGL